MLYKLMKQNTEIAVLNDRGGLAKILKAVSMPVDLRLEGGDDIDTRLNNLQNFYSWCSNRLVSLDRIYVKSILNACGLTQSTNIRNRAYAALQYHALTLKDFYWVQGEDDKLEWDEINLFKNSVSDFATIALTGAPLSVPNAMSLAPDCSTDGIAPKAWVRNGSQIFLLKGDINHSVRKETEASQILRMLGINCVFYKKAEFHNQTVSECEIFTNKHTALVTAEQYSCNKNLQSLLQSSEFCWTYHLMNLGDYLIGNIDRHLGNWGFLLLDTGNFQPAPLMDFHHAFEANEGTYCLPEKTFGHNKTQLQASKEAIEYLRIYYPEKFQQIKANMEKFDQTKFYYGNYVERCIKTLLH